MRGNWSHTCAPGQHKLAAQSTAGRAPTAVEAPSTAADRPAPSSSPRGTAGPCASSRPARAVSRCRMARTGRRRQSASAEHCSAPRRQGDHCEGALGKSSPARRQHGLPPTTSMLASVKERRDIGMSGLAGGRVFHKCARVGLRACAARAGGRLGRAGLRPSVCACARGGWARLCGHMCAYMCA